MAAHARWLAHALLCRAPWFHAGGGGPAAAALWSGGGGGGGVAARAARLQRAAERAGPAAFRAGSTGRADWDALVAGGAGPALLAACLDAELAPAGTGDAGGGGGRAAAGTGAAAALAGGSAAVRLGYAADVLRRRGVCVRAPPRVRARLGYDDDIWNL